MKIVICTGIGMVIIAASAGVMFLAAKLFFKVWDWLAIHTDVPLWAGNIVGGILLLAAACGLLLASHEAGCYVIHFFSK